MDIKFKKNINFHITFFLLWACLFYSKLQKLNLTFFFKFMDETHEISLINTMNHILDEI
jgi:hypothetical protein